MGRDKNSELLLNGSSVPAYLKNPWLPPHTLRVSKRARRFSLKICPYDGLEVIIPVGFNVVELPILLEKHRAWIEKHYKRIKPFLRSSHEEEILDKILLTAIDAVWSLDFIASEAKNIFVDDKNHNQLFLIGNVRNKKMIKESMRLWLKKQAAHHLVPWLQRLSEATQLVFNDVKICHARSLWGSCSAKKNISLNCRLLFLPPALVEYVILHELCHTIHFNHSKNFWDLLKQLSPDCMMLRKELRYANRHLPRWA